VALLGVCYDGSSSYLRGTAEAPQVIRQALWSEAGNPWTELGIDLSTAALDDAGDLMPAQDEDPAQVRRLIEAEVRQIVESGRRPLV
jgi:arginase family enzyme